MLCVVVLLACGGLTCVVLTLSACHRLICVTLIAVNRSQSNQYQLVKRFLCYTVNISLSNLSTLYIKKIKAICMMLISPPKPLWWLFKEVWFVHSLNMMVLMIFLYLFKLYDSCVGSDLLVYFYRVYPVSRWQFFFGDVSPMSGMAAW